MSTTLIKTFSKTIVTAAAVTAILAMPASAQGVKETFEGLLSALFKDKVSQLGTVAQNIVKNKNIFTGRTWTFRDAGLSTAKVSAFTNEICVEKMGAPAYKACADYNGKERTRGAYNLMPNGTGETVKISYKDGIILVESEKIECTTGLKVSWATSTSLIGKQQDSITSTTESTGGVGGCS
jgi:hypothetical protein